MSEHYDIKELSEGTFPLSFKILDRYQQEEPILTGKLKCAGYKKGSSCRGQNTIKLVTFNNKIVIPQLLHRYVVKWYRMYLLHPVLGKMEMIIFEHFYWPAIRDALLKEVT